MNVFSKSVAMQLGIAMLALAPAPAPAQTVTTATAPAKVPNLAAAISSSTVNLRGKSYAATASGSGTCQMGQTMPFDHVASISLASGDHQNKNIATPPGSPQVAIYSPPNADWVIQTYNRVVNSEGGTFAASDSAVPPNFSFTNSVNYSAVSSSLQSFIGSLNLNGQQAAALNAQIQTYLSNYQSYAYSLSSSAGAVQHSAQVWGAGTTNIHIGHSWYDGWIDGTLICAPAFLHDQGQLEGALRSWVSKVVHTVQPTVPMNVK